MTQILAVTCMRDEGPYAAEWIAHLLAVGVDHVLVYSHDWVILLDADEYPVFDAPLSGFPDLIAALPEGTDAVALPWRLFGSAGKEEFDEGLTPERFTRTAPADVLLPAAHFFKSLIRPRAFQKLGVHRPKNRKETSPPLEPRRRERPRPHLRHRR